MPRLLDTANPFNANAPGTEGLAAWLVGLPPRDGGNTLHDETGLTRGATLVNGPTWTADGSGFAGLKFNGSTQYVDCGNLGAFQSNSMSMSATFRCVTPGSGFRGVFVKEFAYGLFVINGVLGTYNWGSSTIISTGINVADGRQHRATLTFDGSGCRIYLDGALVAGPTAFSVSNQGSSLRIGTNGSAGQNFLGDIFACEFGGFKTDAEVQADYIRSLAPITDHPWLNYRRSMVLLGSAPAGVAASAAITEAADTLSASGTVALSATASITEGTDTLVASATVTSGVVASANITEAPDTLTAAGAVAVAVSAAIAEVADSLTASGTVAVVAAANIPEAVDILAALASAPVVAAGANTEGADTLSASATVAGAAVPGCVCATIAVSNRVAFTLTVSNRVAFTLKTDCCSAA